MKEKIIDALIVLALVGLILLAYAYMARQAPMDHVADDEYKRIMRKHGISSLYEDYEGRMYFYRDGRKIYIQGPGHPGAGAGVHVSPGSSVED